jgi:hypothetical protein
MEVFTYVSIVLFLSAFISGWFALRDLRRAKQRMLAKIADSSEKQI